MRFVFLQLDGYGRFLDHEIRFEPGLVVVSGPNERGKSTLRSFICEMLYGQKRSTTQRLYDESNELRRPWARPNPYAGRMSYVLDNGHRIEVHRVFDRTDEIVHVYDRTLGREVTGEFPTMRNRESTFAEYHLGVSKAVFTNVANISHMTLEDLGDEDALTQIREKLLALADTADESGATEKALEIIQERILRIGRPEDTTRPLPKARIRLAELDREHATVTARRQEINDIHAQRRKYIDERAELLQRFNTLSHEMRCYDQIERKRRYEEALVCHRELDVVTQQCFSLSSLREFPIEQEAELQRTLNALATARTQLRRSNEEQTDLEAQHRAEVERLGDLSDQQVDDIPVETEQRLEELETETARLAEQMERAESDHVAAKERLERAQADLASLPDFGRIAADPINQINRLTERLRSAVHQHDEIQKTLESMQNRIKDLETSLARPRNIFEGFEDYAASSAEYKALAHLHETEAKELRTRSTDARLMGDTRRETMHRMRNWSVVFLFAALIFGFATYILSNPLVMIPTGLCIVMTFCFSIFALISYGSMKRSYRTMERALLDLANAEDSLQAQRSMVDQAMHSAGCLTLRELDALYEKYTQEKLELNRLLFDFENNMETACNHAEEVDDHLDAVKTMFDSIGVTFDGPDNIDTAVGAALSRYQEYRDAKRRLDENRSQPEHFELLQTSLRENYDKLREEERNLALHVREVMRSNRFREESRHTSALRAIRAFRTRCSEMRQKRSRLDLLEAQIETARRQTEQDRKEEARCQAVLERFLRKVGADSPERWREMAGQAREYRELREKRAMLLEKQNALLRGETLEELHASLENETEHDTATSTKSIEMIKQEISTCSEQLDRIAYTVEEYDTKLSKLSSGLQSLAVIEEERARMVNMVEELEKEMEAAVYAATIIESVTRNRRTHIAPLLTAGASDYLEKITGGLYNELHINRDFHIAVRIPETHEINERPERRLSKGAVDQIYFALRLALLQTLSQSSELLPMLLDDPFSNYDDVRLARAMSLLKSISAKHQIIIFTCRDDVVRAARSAGGSVVKL